MVSYIIPKEVFFFAFLNTKLMIEATKETYLRI